MSTEPESCECCWDDLPDEERCIWKVDGAEAARCDWCQSCLEHTIENHWAMWLQSIDKADCEAALRRLTAKGPPITIGHVVPDLGQPEFPDLGTLTLPDGRQLSGLLKGAPSTPKELQALLDRLEHIRSMLAVAKPGVQ